MKKREPWIPLSDEARERARNRQEQLDAELRSTLLNDIFLTMVPVLGVALVLFLIFGKPCNILGPEGCIERGGYALYRLQYCILWAALLIGPPVFLLLRFIRRKNIE